MSLLSRVGAIGAMVVALVIGVAVCQTSGTVTLIAPAQASAGPQFLLSKPDGDGPFPAVVLTHGCGGTGRDSRYPTVWRGLVNHAKLLNRNGYVTLIIDSFHKRRITDGCQTGGKYYSLQERDAYAAFDRLAKKPFVDTDRIGYVGQSLGGGTAVRLALRTSVGIREQKDKGTFAALVAYYPWCEPARAFSLVRPLLIMIGSEDDWTPADQCIALSALAKQSTRKPVVRLKVYSGAHHSFDLPMQGPYYVEGSGGRMHTVMGDVGARNDSQRRMVAFFNKYLGPAR